MVAMWRTEAGMLFIKSHVPVGLSCETCNPFLLFVEEEVGLSADTFVHLK